ncbi:hypothetical protein [Mycolicibacterium psychrotolerans]|uniref:Lipoprotein n=2 Tax=Mycolicibacterium psychrotolerans TaxID=216929 RepID=A0A7I7MIA8_9MYCO|nr:hypothetical protein [Mycolicibacterium psychrotolerans]BBX70979.1 hypothetical protein MPSYJ_44400 [Mycolicibacterium psychrotolerans]
MRVLLGTVVALVGITGSACQSSVATASPLLAPGSPFRTTILANAALDPNSEAMIARISRGGGVNAGLIDFALPVYQVTPDTPRHKVSCTMSWGRCPFDGVDVPIPVGARPHRGSDGAMVVLDERTRQAFEFWQAHDNGDQWSTSWGAVTNIDGSGWDRGATASGASRLAGVVRIEEIANGEIPHALAVATSDACAGTFRPPAISTDGRSSRSDCVPEGTRIRLDPGVDLDALTLAPAVRTVARAMQLYGAFVVDRSGSPLSMGFELDTTAPSGSIGAVYQQAGLRWDYDDLPGVPWDRLQVLA